MQETMVLSDEAPTSPLGRPRDPEVDRRVLDTAMLLYAREGWMGFTFESIARAARVGKGALYRRWEDRAALLAATLDARWQDLEAIDTGNARGDLIAVARHLMTLLVDSHAGMVVHMQADSSRFAEVRAVMAPFRERTLTRIRAVIDRAATRGELVPGTDIDLVIEMLTGGVMSHVMARPNATDDAMRANMQAYTAGLVDTLLAGIGRRS